MGLFTSCSGELVTKSVKMAERGRVASGGMWNTQTPTYSKATQDLIKQMMKESKLTNFQQRHLSQAVSRGESLPNNCSPTSSARPQRTPPQSGTVTSKVLTPKNYSHHVRSKEDIEASGAYERPQFVPAALRHYDKEKEKLANVMAFGEDVVPEKFTVYKPKPRARAPDPEVDRFDELEKEIEERQAFLAEMESLGQGGKYRTIIETEISQMVREMEVIDKKRTAELERAIKEQQKNSNTT